MASLLGHSEIRCVYRCYTQGYKRATRTRQFNRPDVGHMSETEYKGVPVTPSQLKTIEALHEQVLANHGEGFEYKRFDVHPFSSNSMLEVMIEIGKLEESPMDAILNRSLRQIFVGERGGCELANPEDSEKRGKIKGLQECITAPTLE